MINLNRVVFSFMIYFSFSFCSDFNLDTIVVKTDEIRGLKQLSTPCFLLIWKNIFFQNNNYRIAHQKNHVKNNNDGTFNQQQPNILWKFEGISMCSFCKNQLPSFRCFITWKQAYNIWKLSKTLNLLFSAITQGKSSDFFTVVLTNQDLLILI